MVVLRTVLSRGLKSGGKGNVQLVLNSKFGNAYWKDEWDTGRQKMVPIGGTQAIGTALQGAIGKFILSSSYKYMCLVADYAADILSYMDMPYDEITGNLSESMGVAVIGTNKRKDRFTVGRYYAPYKRMLASGGSRKFHSTMHSLGEGDVYPLLQYANGDSVPRAGFKKPYRGETDLGAHTHGKQQRADFIQSLRTVKANASKEGTLYTVYAFFAMPYAGYVSYKHRSALPYILMSALRDAASDAQIDFTPNG